MPRWCIGVLPTSHPAGVSFGLHSSLDIPIVATGGHVWETLRCHIERLGPLMVRWPNSSDVSHHGLHDLLMGLHLRPLPPWATQSIGALDVIRLVDQQLLLDVELVLLLVTVASGPQLLGAL